MAYPAKYKPEFCAELKKHMEQGLSFASFAGLKGVSRASLYVWADKNPEFAQAKAEAEGACLYFWERKGIENLENRSFNSAVWIYNMKVRFRSEGWHAPDQEAAANKLVPLEPPKKLTQDEMLSLVKAAKERK